MGRYWQIRCPYCHAEIARGSGYDDKIPDVCVPVIRCEICGGLMKTGSSEYLTMPVQERLKLRRNQKNCEYIERSLDRTNNKEYMDFLQKNGFIIYPITNADKDRFKSVRFDLYINRQASADATQSLYNVGILIREEWLDKATGGIKTEILEENQRVYDLKHKIARWSAGTGLAVGFVFVLIFLGINPNSYYLFLIGVLMGLGCYFAVGFGMGYYYENKCQQTNNTTTQKNQAKKLLSDTGKIFFINYYDQLKKYNTIDVIDIIKENYSEESKKRRIVSAKKIFSLNIQTDALKIIVQNEDGVAGQEIIDKAKSFLEKEVAEQALNEKQKKEKEEQIIPSCANCRYDLGDETYCKMWDEKPVGKCSKYKVKTN